MIFREEKNFFVFTEQNNHAHLSGQVAAYFHPFFAEDLFWKEALLAILEHDRSWIALDKTPIWNEEKNRPFDFTDFPEAPKLKHYKLGLDETEKINKYAALLCSMHYASFVNTKNPNAKSLIFYNEEIKRQARLKKTIKSISAETLLKHFKLLQLCDSLSLYICLNTPGVSKENEHPYFKNGFKNSEIFNTENEKKLMPKWVSSKEIKITPSPFKQSFSITLKQKKLLKTEISKVGISEAYRKASYSFQEVVFLGED